jgi:hypothetical protein
MAIILRGNMAASAAELPGISDIQLPIPRVRALEGVATNSGTVSQVFTGHGKVDLIESFVDATLVSAKIERGSRLRK